MFGSLALFTKRKDYELSVRFPSDRVKACIGFIKIPLGYFDEDLTNTPSRAVFLSNSPFRGSSYSSAGGNFLYPFIFPLCANFPRVCNGAIYVPYVVRHAREHYDQNWWTKSYNLPFSIFYHSIFFEKESYDQIVIKELKSLNLYDENVYNEYGLLFNATDREIIGRNIRPNYPLSIAPSSCLIVEAKRSSAYIFDGLLYYASPGILIDISDSPDGKWHVRFFKSLRVFDPTSQLTLLYDWELPESYTHVVLSFGVIDDEIIINLDTLERFVVRKSDIFRPGAALGLTYSESFLPILDYCCINPYPTNPVTRDRGIDDLEMNWNSCACNIDVGRVVSFPFNSISCFSTFKRVSCLPSSGTFIEVSGSNLNVLAQALNVPVSQILKVEVLNPNDFGIFSAVEKYREMPFRTGLIPLPTKFLLEAGFIHSGEIIAIMNIGEKRYKTRGFKFDLSPMESFYGYDFYLISLPNEEFVDSAFLSGRFECIVVIDGDYDAIDAIELPQAQPLFYFDFSKSASKGGGFSYHYVPVCFDSDRLNPDVLSADKTNLFFKISFQDRQHISKRAFSTNFYNFYLGEHIRAESFYVHEPKDPSNPYSLMWLYITTCVGIYKGYAPYFYVEEDSRKYIAHTQEDGGQPQVVQTPLYQIKGYLVPPGLIVNKHLKMFYILDYYKTRPFDNITHRRSLGYLYTTGVYLHTSLILLPDLFYLYKGFDRLAEAKWEFDLENPYSTILVDPFTGPKYSFCMGRVFANPNWGSEENFIAPMWPLDVAALVYPGRQGLFDFFSVSGLKEIDPHQLESGYKMDSPEYMFRLYNIRPIRVNFGKRVTPFHLAVKRNWPGLIKTQHLSQLPAIVSIKNTILSNPELFFKSGFFEQRTLYPESPESILKRFSFTSEIKLDDFFYPLKRFFYFQDSFAFRRVEFSPFVWAYFYEAGRGWVLHRYTGYYFDLSSFLRFTIPNINTERKHNMTVSESLFFSDSPIYFRGSTEFFLKKMFLGRAISGWEYYDSLAVASAAYSFRLVLNKFQIGVLNYLFNSADFRDVTTNKSYQCEFNFSFVSDWKSVSEQGFFNELRNLISSLFSINVDEIIGIDISLCPYVTLLNNNFCYCLDKNNRYTGMWGESSFSFVSNSYKFSVKNLSGFAEEVELFVRYVFKFKLRLQGNREKEVILPLPFSQQVPQNLSVPARGVDDTSFYIDYSINRSGNLITIRFYAGQEYKTISISMALCEYLYNLVDRSNLELYNPDFSYQVQLKVRTDTTLWYIHRWVDILWELLQFTFNKTSFSDEGSLWFTIESWDLVNGITLCSGEPVQAWDGSRFKPIVGIPILYRLKQAGINVGVEGAGSGHVVVNSLQHNLYLTGKTINMWGVNPTFITLSYYWKAISENKASSFFFTYHNLVGYLVGPALVGHSISRNINASVETRFISRIFYNLIDDGRSDVFIPLLFWSGVFSWANFRYGVKIPLTFSVFVEGRVRAFGKNESNLNLWALVARKIGDEEVEIDLIYEIAVFDFGMKALRDALSLSSEPVSTSVENYLFSYKLQLFGMFLNMDEGEDLDKLPYWVLILLEE